MTTLAVIPSRGGSQGLRRKNLLPDEHGTPLFLTAAQAAQRAGCEVIVATDDPEVRSICHINQFTIMWRGPDLADVPVDRVVEYVVETAKWPGPVLLVQPTVQPMNHRLLSWFLRHATADTTPATLAVDDRHLIWHQGQAFTDRVERQQEADWPHREMGVRWWPRLPTGVSAPSPVRAITAPFDLVDIDTSDDYRQLERRLAIGFIIRANAETGHGHLRRALTLAEGMQHHDITIVPTPDSSDEARDLLEERGWLGDVLDGDVHVWDTLTRPTDTAALPTPSVAFETHIRGGAVATVNALYGDGDYTGARYAVLRQEFLTGMYRVAEDASKVVAVFGGTDPSRLTDLTVKALRGYDVDVIRPEDERSVAAAMHDADLLITSGGRTVFEAAAVGIPTVVMCQNMRELSHTHLGVGNINLGDGRLVDDERLRHTVDRVLGDYRMRLDLSDTARRSIDRHGADRVRRIIEHVGLYGEKP